MSQVDIVLAEDHEDTRTIYRTILEYAGYSVSCAADGVEALGLVQRLKPRLALVDLVLPGISGFDLMRTIRSQSDTRGIRMIAITADVQKSSHQEAHRAGCERVLVKPCTPREVLHAVWEALSLDPVFSTAASGA